MAAALNNLGHFIIHLSYVSFNPGLLYLDDKNPVKAHQHFTEALDCLNRFTSKADSHPYYSSIVGKISILED